MSELEVQTRAAQNSRDEATSEESKSEHQYDMRGQEAAYLAEGQARLAADLQQTIEVYQSLPLPAWSDQQAIGIGAVVTLENPQHRAMYFVGPRSGGREVAVDGITVTVVTPQSPLGRQLIGRRTGDPVELPSRTGPQAHRISSVR